MPLNPNQVDAGFGGHSLSPPPLLGLFLPLNPNPFIPQAQAQAGGLPLNPNQVAGGFVGRPLSPPNVVYQTFSVSQGVDNLQGAGGFQQGFVSQPYFHAAQFGDAFPNVAGLQLQAQQVQQLLDADDDDAQEDNAQEVADEMLNNYWNLLNDHGANHDAIVGMGYVLGLLENGFCSRFNIGNFESFTQ